jgi:hypothetical protein
MGIRVRAHYDGKAIILDEPVDLPVDEPIEAELHVLSREEKAVQIERKLAAIERFSSRAVHGTNIPDEALRRENMYEDRL